MNRSVAAVLTVEGLMTTFSHVPLNSPSTYSLAVAEGASYVRASLCLWGHVRMYVRMRQVRQNAK